MEIAFEGHIAPDGALYCRARFEEMPIGNGNTTCEAALRLLDRLDIESKKLRDKYEKKKGKPVQVMQWKD